MNYTYIAIPIVTALIGWLTNVIAVKMLFHPRRPINLLLFKLHGLIPKRHDALARSIADLFERELLSSDELAIHLQNLEIDDDVLNLLDGRLRTAITKFASGIPMASMFLNDAMIDKIAGKLKAEIVEMLPELKMRLAANVSRTLDLRNLIEEKVLGFSVRKLEGIVMHVATKELHSIEVLGGVLGLLIGLAQVGIMIAVAA
jgi:uncharacterized membrane protein YheB (UPF0754 family)